MSGGNRGVGCVLTLGQWAPSPISRGCRQLHELKKTTYKKCWNYNKILVAFVVLHYPLTPMPLLTA